MKKYFFLTAAYLCLIGFSNAQKDTTCKRNSVDFVSCEQKNESLNLANCQVVAYRKAGELIIKLQNNTSQTYKNTIFDSLTLNYDSVKTFIFKKYYKTNGFVLIEKISAEGTTMLMINLVNGKNIEINWFPIFSPDNKKFAVVSGTDFNIYSPEMVQVYSLKKNNFEKEFEYRPSGALTYFGNCKWQGNDRIAVNKINYAKTNSNGKPLKSDLTVAIVDKKWSVMGK